LEEFGRFFLKASGLFLCLFCAAFVPSEIRRAIAYNPCENECYVRQLDERKSTELPTGMIPLGSE